MFRRGALSRRCSWVHLQPRRSEVEKEECRHHEAKEHSENYGFHLRLSRRLGLKRFPGFEEDIQRPIHHSEVQPLFHPGFESSEDRIGCHWIIYFHVIAEPPPSPGCFQNILSRDLPVFNHGYSTRTALTLPAVYAGRRLADAFETQHVARKDEAVARRQLFEEIFLHAPQIAAARAGRFALRLN